jgi:hypothetical protein
MKYVEWLAWAHSLQVTAAIAQHLGTALRQVHLSFAGIAS